MSYEPPPSLCCVYWFIRHTPCLQPVCNQFANTDLRSLTPGLECRIMVASSLSKFIMQLPVIECMGVRSGEGDLPRPEAKKM